MDLRRQTSALRLKLQDSMADLGLMLLLRFVSAGNPNKRCSWFFFSGVCWGLLERRKCWYYRACQQPHSSRDALLLLYPMNKSQLQAMKHLSCCLHGSKGSKASKACLGRVSVSSPPPPRALQARVLSFLNPSPKPSLKG